MSLDLDSLPPEIAQQLGAKLAQQFAEQEAADKQMREQMEASQAKIRETRDALMAGLGGRGAQQIPVEIQQIVAALTAQPRLVAPVQQFLTKLVAKINSAVDSAVAESLGT